MTRREALLSAAAAGLALAGCGSGAHSGAASGSTLISTWGDPVGDGQLRVMRGEPMVARTELGPRERLAASWHGLRT